MGTRSDRGEDEGGPVAIAGSATHGNLTVVCGPHRERSGSTVNEGPGAFCARDGIATENSV
jgi:hypothetical protein